MRIEYLFGVAVDDVVGLLLPFKHSVLIPSPWGWGEQELTSIPWHIPCLRFFLLLSDAFWILGVAPGLAEILLPLDLVIQLLTKVVSLHLLPNFGLIVSVLQILNFSWLSVRLVVKWSFTCIFIIVLLDMIIVWSLGLLPVPPLLHILVVGVNLAYFFV